MQKKSGFWIRLLSNFLDGLVLMVIYLPISFLFFGVSVTEYFTSEEVNWSSTAVESLISLCYIIILPMVLAGATLGKKAVGIQIRHIDGTPLKWSTMIMREFVGKTLIYSITLGIASIVSAFMVGLREDRRSIHDLIAKTEVVYPNKFVEKEEVIFDETNPSMKDTTNGNAIVSMIFGILSLVTPLITLPFVDDIYFSLLFDSGVFILSPILMIVFATIGVIFYYKSIKVIKRTQQGGKGFAITGFVCSILGYCFSVLMFIVIIIFLFAVMFM